MLIAVAIPAMNVPIFPEKTLSQQGALTGFDFLVMELDGAAGVESAVESQASENVAVESIAASEAFGVDLTALMMENAIPAIGALIVTIVLATMLSKKGKDAIPAAEDTREKASLPGFMAAFAGPLVVIILLALRPICGISIDPLIALPLGGLVCILVTGNAKDTISITEFGLRSRQP